MPKDGQYCFLKYSLIWNQSFYLTLPTLELAELILIHPMPVRSLIDEQNIVTHIHSQSYERGEMNKVLNRVVISLGYWIFIQSLWQYVLEN